MWPQWAAAHFFDGGTFTYYRHFVGHGYEPETPSSWQQKPFELKVRAVCKACNNGWMSELENAAKDVLFAAALQGHGRALHHGGQQTMAAWALKTAAMAEHTNAAARRGIPRAEYVHLWKYGEPSTNVRVWVASYVGALAVALALPFGIDVDMARNPAPDRGERDVWGSTILLGPVVFQVLGSAVPGLLEIFELAAPNTHALWPHHRSFTWTPRPGFDDQAVMQLHDEYLGRLRGLSTSTDR